MSLALHVALDGAAELRRLDFRLQEEVLDELERLAASPDLIPPAMPDGGTVYAFARVIAGVPSVLLLALRYNSTSQGLTMLGVRSLPS